MPAPPKLENEDDRLALLQACGILDTEPEPTFDDVVGLASHICDVPVALVTLIDHDRQWFKARIGLPATEMSRDQSFCAHAIVAPDMPLVVPDALLDERFADNPLVTNEPRIRFYAGIPLVLASNLAIGTLCVIDRIPRELSVAQLGALEMLGRQVTSELRLRRKLAASIGQPRRGRGLVTPDPLVEPRPGDTTLAPVVLGRYRLEDVIGAGGMGVVAGAVDLTSGRPVAIKFILPEVTEDGLVERFAREAQLLMRIHSQHVTRVLDAGNLANGSPFIVMERLEGTNLDVLLKARGPLPIDEALAYMIQACAGVADAHAAGVLHRDLKPSNLFLAQSEDGTIVLKLIDFGIAKLRASENSPTVTLTNTSVLLGSPDYMSPEQMTLGDDLDERTDVWSLGVVLYELLTNRRPFGAESTIEVCARVLTAAAPSLTLSRPDLPPEVERIVTRCLAKPRDERYASVAELAHALTAVREMRQSTAGARDFR